MTSVAKHQDSDLMSANTEQIAKLSLETVNDANGINLDAGNQNGVASSYADGFSFGETNSYIKNKELPKGFAYTKTSKNANVYNMNHPEKGHCVIFNHHVFDSGTGLNVRNGTNRDRDNVQGLFSKLGFEVEVCDNFSVKRIHQTLENMAYNVDHSNKDCLVVIFMSHGEDGRLFGRDTAFDTDKLYNHFTADNCPSLANKPKLFFIQACRGDQIDEGVTLVKCPNEDETDGVELFYKIPVHADFLVCWSTVPGHFSWRNTTNGSWFIQALVHTMFEKCIEEDLLSLMTMVNHRLVNEFESNCPTSPVMHKKKQTAYFVSTLTRKVFLKPPSKQ